MKKKHNGKVMSKELEGLLYQVLETELGGVEVYSAAIECAVHSELEEEWQKYLAETKEHVRIARSLLEEMGLDPDRELPAREPVRRIGSGLVAAMTVARKESSPAEAQLVAAECVVQAETKDHLNWELLGTLAEKSEGEVRDLLSAAVEKVETQEDHHLYHTKGWARELWLEALGLPAVLPPPEEVKNVKTAIGASRAEKARDSML
jgi:hypothetical protein